MARLFIIPDMIQAVPGNDVGADGDIVANPFQGTAQLKRSGAWTALVANLSGSVSPVGSVAPNSIGQYYANTADSTYYISTGLTNNDWTQIGGSSVNYKVYRALLSQSGTDAPVATVLENTLGGDVVYSYAGFAGAYKLTFAGGFDPNKTFPLAMPNAAFNGNVSSVRCDAFNNGNGNQLFLMTTDSTGSGLNDWGALIPIEILVYP